MSAQAYLDLIASQHGSQPKYAATVALMATPLATLQDVLRALPTSFDIDTAIGVQLDVCGQWIGLSRRLPLPLVGIYFAWGIASVGWGSGVWKGEFDPVDGLVSLPDDLYRAVLKSRIAINQWDGTVGGAYAAWQISFGAVTLSIIDHQDMSITVGLSGGDVSAALRALLINNHLPLKPVGVRIRYYAIPPATGALFAWGVLPSAAFAGWGTGQWADHVLPSS